MILGFKKQFVEPILAGTKIHTIREDKGNRWRSGKAIHMATGTRTKNYECFSIGRCVNTQFVLIDPEVRQVYIIPIGGIAFRPLPEARLDEFVRNDGFISTEYFWNWWKEPFEGKIIHWTDFKY